VLLVFSLSLELPFIAHLMKQRYRVKIDSATFLAIRNTRVLHGAYQHLLISLSMCKQKRELLFKVTPVSLLKPKLNQRQATVIVAGLIISKLACTRNEN
jgi:hypothetical protein